MVGFPKWLNSRADVEYVVANFPKEQWRELLEAMLEEQQAWFNVGIVPDGETGVTDATHKVVINPAHDGAPEKRYQFELKYNPGCALARLGISAQEIIAWLE